MSLEIEIQDISNLIQQEKVERSKRNVKECIDISNKIVIIGHKLS
jgi:hypothetical protein